MNGKKIYMIKNIDIKKLGLNSPLDKWFISLVNKKIEELSVLDISRMLRQEIFPDIAMPVTFERLMENPFEGEMYDGQLLELYIRCLSKYPVYEEREKYIYLCAIASKNIDLYDWADEYSKQEYKKVLNKLEMLTKITGDYS